MHSASSRLGELLLQRELVERMQLADGLRAQAIQGGRLGSNLVELGHVSVDLLTSVLSDQQSVPAADSRVLKQIDHSVIKLVPAEVCEQYCVLPLAREGHTLHLAMLDPGRPELLDTLEQTLGFQSIHPYALAQLRLLYLLEIHYGIARPKRFLRSSGTPIDNDRRNYPTPTSLSRVSARGQRPAGELHEPPPPSGPARPAPPPRSRHITGPGHPVNKTSSQRKVGSSGTHAATAGHEAPASVTSSQPSAPAPHEPPAPRGFDRAALSAMGSGLHARARPLKGRLDMPEAKAPVYVDRPDSRPISTLADSDDDLDLEITVDTPEALETPQDNRSNAILQRICEGIDNARDRDGVVSRLLAPVFPNTSLTLLLLPKGALAVALAAWGSNPANDAVKSLGVPLAPQSLLGRAMQQQRVITGLGANDPLQQMIADHLGAPPPHESCVAPICLEAVPVNLLCVQSTGSLPSNASTMLEQITARAAAAYRRLGNS
jgi:hypothetical protein